MTEETVPVRQRTKVNCLHWDSLMQLTLISAIEQEFGVSISNDDAVDLNSFEAALQILREKLAAQNA
ncbi:MAG: acyl carrier protein [Elusimicrobia bacterium]|nr:acyl carrier protein [Elusimicrobiota bacterium]